MRKLALMVVLGAAFGLFENSATAQSCPNGTCPRQTAMTPYRYAPATTYARGYAAAPVYAAPRQAPTYTYQYPARPAYRVAQARTYYYQRNYAPAAAPVQAQVPASCPNGNCAYTYIR